jgi:hypothetical protein
MPEKYVPSGGKGPRLDRPIQRICLAIRMHTHPAEVGAECLLHWQADAIREGLSA